MLFFFLSLFAQLKRSHKLGSQPNEMQGNTKGRDACLRSVSSTGNDVESVRVLARLASLHISIDVFLILSWLLFVPAPCPKSEYLVYHHRIWIPLKRYLYLYTPIYDIFNPHLSISLFLSILTIYLFASSYFLIFKYISPQAAQQQTANNKHTVLNGSEIST